MCSSGLPTSLSLKHFREKFPGVPVENFRSGFKVSDAEIFEAMMELLSDKKYNPLKNSLTATFKNMGSIPTKRAMFRYANSLDRAGKEAIEIAGEEHQIVFCAYVCLFVSNTLKSAISS